MQMQIRFEARDAEGATGLERTPLMRLWAARLQVAPSINRRLTPQP